MQTPRRFAGGFVLALAVSLASTATPQQPPSPAAPAPQKQKKDRPKRVWTDDDLKGLRKPWDEHAEQKAKAEAEAAAAKAAPPEEAGSKAEAQTPEPAEVPDFDPPKTREEAEQRLKEKREEIANQRAAIQDVRDEYFNAGNDQIREELRLRIEKMTRDLEAAEAALVLLEKSVEEFRKKEEAPKPPPSPAS